MQGVLSHERCLDGLAATVAALVQQTPSTELLQQPKDVEAIEVHESRLKALAARATELVLWQKQQNQQPVIEAITVQAFCYFEVIEDTVGAATLSLLSMRPTM